MKYIINGGYAVFSNINIVKTLHMEEFLGMLGLVAVLLADVKVCYKSPQLSYAKGVWFRPRSLLHITSNMK